MQTTRFQVDDVLSIPDRILAVQEMLKGTFDDEVKRVKAARAELAKQEAIAKTMEEANQIKADAEKQAQAAGKLVADAEKQAQAIIDQANIVMTSAKAAQVNANEAAAKVASDRTTLDAQKRAQDERQALLDAREKGINSGQVNLQKAIAEHYDRVSKFNARLEALKVT